MANKQIDQQLDLKRKHERHLKLLQRELNNVNARLQEYQLGIPIKESELKSETVNVENQIDELESQYELKKMEITKKFIHDEERFVKDLDALVEDAQTEDSQARDMKLAKLELLNEEKKSLMEKIGLAKGAFAEELQSLKEKYKDEEDKQRAKLGNLKETVLSERKKLQKQYDSLKREYDDLKEKDISTDGEILRCKSNIEATEKSIQELKYSLCTEFENGEFQSTKREWEEANDCLQLERYKRLKLEIQIRNLSGIPSILIMESKLNQSFKQSKLREFLKPDNYDWKLEVLTNMENSLNGISQSLIICNESDTKLAEMAQQVQSHLQKTVANNDRFKTSQVSIEIPLLSDLRKTYPQIPDIPTSYAAILLDNHNPITGASRCSLIFMVHISKSIQLPELPLFTITQTNLCATNVTDSWEPELIRITSLPPTASSLCTEFENGEFQSTKREWEEANDCLQLERYKRLKLEIQIRNVSGIPSILIMESKLNQSFKQSKLREFLKPDNYDWKLEVLTNMENSLNGISQSLIICNESDTKLAEMAQQVQSHLQKTVANNDRFKTSQVSIEIPLLSDLRKTYPQIPDIPTSYAAILLDNHNPITGASRCSLIFMVHISKSIQLSELPLFTITQTNLCATNVTDSWEPELIRITGIPPVTSRKAYEFLN
ncbi:hypothetical protein JL09_g2102 [Pichia kudriavzevii]|uniref:Uncharacterized protein n=1 Tax=Pichia kudriavzevii TaxID=4909 RepID=A0A099P3X7_PICKU|nr:hypothetical protein JL09_g2102 [Pichia kudriavzevii]